MESPQKGLIDQLDTNQKKFLPLVLAFIYSLWVYFFVGFRTDHILFLSICLGGYYISLPSRKFVVAFSSFIVYWIIYDSLRLAPNHLFNDVHIAQPYLAEKAMFGIETAQGILTPNEYFAIHNWTIMDVLGGIFYINWVPIPLLFGIYLLYKDKENFLYFGSVFLLINIIGFIIYYIYPAAPPWYVANYGFEYFSTTPGDPAGLIRFDEYFGITLFQGMYGMNSKVFAAIPSLHSAYPMFLFLFGMRRKMYVLAPFFIIFIFGIWFSAVYLGHHYIIDVAAGASCTLVGFFLFFFILNKFPSIKNWYIKLSKMI